MNWPDLIIGLIGGGGITTVVVALINKKKSPYDLYTEFIQTQREWMERVEADLTKERQDSMEKTYIITQTRLCEAKISNPKVKCPVDEANDARLKNKCRICHEQTQSGN